MPLCRPHSCVAQQLALEENAELAAELEGLPDEELETRCRRSGLSKRGGRAAQLSR